MPTSLLMEQKKVLCTISHETIDEAILGSLLSKSDIIVERAPSAQEALDLVRHFKYDVILTDVLLAPGAPMSDAQLRATWNSFASEPHAYGEMGLYFIKMARQPPSLNLETPIVVKTMVKQTGSVKLPDAQRRAMEAGANYYLGNTGAAGYTTLADKIVELARPR